MKYRAPFKFLTLEGPHVYEWIKSKGVTDFIKNLEIVQVGA